MVESLLSGFHNHRGNAWQCSSSNYFYKNAQKSEKSQLLSGSFGLYRHHISLYSLDALAQSFRHNKEKTW